MICLKFVPIFMLVLNYITGQKIISDEKWRVLCRNVPERVYTRLPGECARFFICVEGYPSILDCPDNLYFDPVNIVCGYSGDIKCSKDVEEVTTRKNVEPTTTSLSTSVGVWTHEMSPEEEETTENSWKNSEPDHDSRENDEEILDNNSQVECCRFFGTRRVCTEC